MTEPFCEDYIYLFETRSAACNYCVENNMLFPMFFLISFIPFTILFSSWVVAKFVYLPHMKAVENEKDIEWPDEEEEEIPYEEKYALSDKKDEKRDRSKLLTSVQNLGKGILGAITSPIETTFKSIGAILKNIVTGGLLLTALFALQKFT